MYTLGVGIKLSFFKKSWNDLFANVFLLGFMTYPIGSDCYLVVFLTILNFFKCFHGFKCFPLLLIMFIISLFCCWPPLLLEAISAFSACAYCCFPSLNDGLLFVSFMLELSFRSRTSCWSCFICCFSDSFWLQFVGQVDPDDDFPLLLMLKFLSCLTKLVCLLVCYFRLSLSSNWFCFPYVLKYQSRGDSLFILVFHLRFELKAEWLHSVCISKYWTFWIIAVVFNFTLNHLKLFLDLCCFSMKSL